jgi:hypothetical protein
VIISERHATTITPVLRIIVVCARNEVIGSHTRRVIAAVANKEMWIKWTVDELIGNPMCFSVYPSDTDSPIPIAIASSCPYPAITGLINMSPKTIRDLLCICLFKR